MLDERILIIVLKDMVMISIRFTHNKTISKRNGFSKKEWLIPSLFSALLKTWNIKPWNGIMEQKRNVIERSIL